ncbi:MAG: SDR family NAD(P)-dependent oxidoreductase [Propionibacteriaceae bacterium]
MGTALVTGATSGIGAAFARQLAARGDNLVLVARDEAKLHATAADLRQTHGVEVEILVADLSQRADMDRVAERIESVASPIDTLINNAGCALHIRLTDPDIDRHEQALNLMCLAVLILGGAAGRAMSQRGQGTIITTGSAQGWLTTGHYAAIKAWANTWSQSLSNELAGTGVQVTLLAPGWVRTEFHQRAGVSSSMPGWVWVTADEAAATALADAQKGRAISVPSTKWRIAVAFAQILPARVIRKISAMLNRSRGR